jgi:hypothetical protein
MDILACAIFDSNGWEALCLPILKLMAIELDYTPIADRYHNAHIVACMQNIAVASMIRTH